MQQESIAEYAISSRMTWVDVSGYLYAIFYFLFFWY